MPREARIVPEARIIVERAVAVYRRHTAAWLIGIIVHGSAVKGGFIPGCSDIDVQIYLEEKGLTPAGFLPAPVGLALQRDLQTIDPAPFHSLQAFALPPASRPGWIGPIPGAYVVVHGRLPMAEATAAELLAGARRDLAALVEVPGFVAGSWPDHGPQRLRRLVRSMCTAVWPVLRQVVSLQTGDPLAVWSVPIQQVLGRLPAGSPLRILADSYYQSVTAFYPAQNNVEIALRSLELGLAVVDAAHAWYVGGDL